jgi:hypothetical protein
MSTSSHGAYFDFGDAAQSTIDVKSFRIKNNSSTYTANSSQFPSRLSLAASPRLQDSFNTRSMRLTWVLTGNIGNLAPSALSRHSARRTRQLLRRRAVAVACCGRPRVDDMTCHRHLILLPKSMRALAPASRLKSYQRSRTSYHLLISRIKRKHQRSARTTSTLSAGPN